MREAFGYLRRYQGTTFLIHLTPSAHVGYSLRQLLRDIALLQQMGIHTVCVIAEREGSGGTLSPLPAGEKHWPALQSAVAWLKRYCYSYGIAVQEYHCHFNNGGAAGVPIPINMLDVKGITQHAANGLVVLSVHHHSHRVAAEGAIMIKASKLIYLESNDFFLRVAHYLRAHYQPNIYRQALYLPATMLQEIITQAMLPSSDLQLLQELHRAVEGGVVRSHLLNIRYADTLLAEIFSHQGSGIMIYANRYEHIRALREEEIGEILQFTQPLSRSGILRNRSLRDITAHLNDYVVCETDGTIQGCVALKARDAKYYEVGALAVHPAYQRFGIGRRLIEYCITQVKKYGASYIVAVTYRGVDWFTKLGFEKIEPHLLPKEIIAEINERSHPQRKERPSIVRLTLAQSQ